MSKYFASVSEIILPPPETGHWHPLYLTDNDAMRSDSPSVTTTPCSGA